MNQRGRLHPMTVAIREIAEIFGRMGFGIAYGPELEDDWHNFSALNVPEDHPARDMQDTFFTTEQPPRVPRTHTSSVQIRYMERQVKAGIMPPYRIIAPGKVFRNEATDATHEAQFNQLEGLAIGPAGSVTFAHLKGTFVRFFSEYFGKEVPTRFRPSYFPFVEPGLEVDVWFEPEGKKGIWLETGGAGMVHPQVLKNVGLDPEKYEGFAFGPGLERIVMLKYGIPDVRLLHSGDIRFIYGFEAAV
ncbi:phenylalanine--tRNA ligase subunit alpha [Candidatus Kaiserbacteria bacterium]|nr:phenylalanine--tRNA ligase subunit alpha [Candidatus Kaiserbacteria bacterium]